MNTQQVNSLNQGDYPGFYTHKNCGGIVNTQLGWSCTKCSNFINQSDIEVKFLGLLSEKELNILKTIRSE